MLPEMILLILPNVRTRQRMLIGANRPTPNHKGEISSCVAYREWSGEEFSLLSGMLSSNTIESRIITHGWQLACNRHGFSLITKNEDMGTRF